MYTNTILPCNRLPIEHFIFNTQKAHINLKRLLCFVSNSIFNCFNLNVLLTPQQSYSPKVWNFMHLSNYVKLMKHNNLNVDII